MNSFICAIWCRSWLIFCAVQKINLELVVVKKIDAFVQLDVRSHAKQWKSSRKAKQTIELQYWTSKNVSFVQPKTPCWHRLKSSTKRYTVLDFSFWVIATRVDTMNPGILPHISNRTDKSSHMLNMRYSVPFYSYSVFRIASFDQLSLSGFFCRRTNSNRTRIGFARVTNQSSIFS